MGFNTVSFYVFWGILEPKRGEISFEGFRDLQPWFDAAKQAGIYLMARPGEYRSPSQRCSISLAL